MALPKSRSYKVFFVETPSPEENCFVITTNRSSAAKFERDSSGFDGNDCTASYVCDLEDSWVRNYIRQHKDHDESNCWYLYQKHYYELGIVHTVIEGDDVFLYHDKIFHKQGDMNYVAEIIGDAKGAPHRVIIRSVVELLEILKRDAQGDWIYRGQSSCFWPLKRAFIDLL